MRQDAGMDFETPDEWARSIEIVNELTQEAERLGEYDAVSKAAKDR